MLVPDEIKKTVVFVAQKDHLTGGFIFRGTAFLCGLSMDEKTHVFYFATAKHVIQKIKETGATDFYLRLNTKSKGAQWYSSGINDWFFPEDPNIDLACSNFNYSEDLDHKIIPITMTLDEVTIKKENIGVGDEVFITGLFKNHFGKLNNIPIVRVGNIASMVGEKIDTDMGPMDAYLIEARSIGGLSGSPVFVNLGLHRFIDGKVKESLVGNVNYFFGLIHGHFDEKSSEVDGLDSDEQQTKKINMGIAIVVPAIEVKKLLERSDIKAQREIAYEKIRDSKK